MLKRFLSLMIVGIISLGLIGCGTSSEVDRGSHIEDSIEGIPEDVTYTKYRGDISEGEIVKAEVMVDADNLSVLNVSINGVLDNNSGRVGFIDTTGTTDLKVGDCVIIIITNNQGNEKQNLEYTLITGPMSKEEIHKVNLEEESMKYFKEQEEKKDSKDALEQNNISEEDKITVGKRMNDNRDRGSKDEGLWITLNDQSIWFVPELNQAFFKANYENFLREITVDSKSELGTIRGTFDAEVVLSGENKVVIAIKPSDKYEYYCLKVDKKYSIGDKFDVSIDNEGKFFIGQ